VPIYSTLLTLPLVALLNVLFTWLRQPTMVSVCRLIARG